MYRYTASEWMQRNNETLTREQINPERCHDNKQQFTWHVNQMFLKMYVHLNWNNKLAVDLYTFSVTSLFSTYQKLTKPQVTDFVS